MDEVWWARRDQSYVDLYGDKMAAEIRSYPRRTVRYFDWMQQFDGPEMETGDIIPIRPLRIEVVRFPLPETSEVEGVVEKGGVE